MKLYRDEGVVLRTWKFGEADRIVVVMTKGHGKVRAVAKGIRKTGSKFGSRLEPISHVQLQLHRGRELDLITQVERIEAFRAVREDLDRLTRATPMLEAVDQLAQERAPNARLLRMLVGGLQALEADGGPAVVPTFFLKVLAQEGFRPEVDVCVECGATDGLVAFDMESGGVLCGEHRVGAPLSPGALDLLQRTLGGRLGSVLNEKSSPALAEVDSLATRALEHHLERRLRSITALES